MRQNDRITGVEHIWVQKSDRWILMERYESGYLGLNFMQGDEYQIFKEVYTEMDRGLSEFYNIMYDSLKILRQSVDPINFVDRVIWIYFEAKANHEWHG